MDSRRHERDLLDWRQRWQTKRGYPGLEHTVDWLTLDLSASIFPAPNRDNFGSQVGFIEYAFVWNVGDRNSLYSNGWFDPFEFGARYWDVGTTFSRDDRTTFNLAYRQTDPLASKVVSLSTTYVFSPKYAMTAITAYDFGFKSTLSNSIYFTRVGPDAQVTVGRAGTRQLLPFPVQVLPRQEDAWRGRALRDCRLSA